MELVSGREKNQSVNGALVDVAERQGGSEAIKHTPTDRKRIVLG